MIDTLGQLIEHVEASDAIPASRKPHLLWSLRRTIVLVGGGLEDVKADPRTVLRQLDQMSPAMAGLSPQSLSNLKSLVRSALGFAAPHLAPRRSHARLEGQWKALEDRLAVREQRQLSRFLRFAQAMGWPPQEIGEEHVQRFADYLEHEVMLPQAADLVRATRRAWNRAADTVPEWPDRRLLLTQPRRTPYWLRLNQLPPSLRQEVQDYLHRLEHPDPFLDPDCKKLSPAPSETTGRPSSSFPPRSSRAARRSRSWPR